MLIDVKVAVAGRRFAYRRGRYDVPEEIAKDLIQSGHAEKVSKGGRPKKETVTESEVESHEE